SVSISGYHIAEAGANPISQLAFTLSNGFTFVEAYLARGMAIDDFAPNLSFFFSNGMDPEYTVMGRVARRIWAVAMRDRYGANERSQKLKYHVQTSGRSLHAQEVQFNDIRTTLQALIAIYDNCNSLHTNAFDEAITTPTEEEKVGQLARLADFQARHADAAPAMLKRLQDTVIANGNVFEVLIEAVRVCSLGQITDALFEVGGQYRRNM